MTTLAIDPAVGLPTTKDTDLGEDLGTGDYVADLATRVEKDTSTSRSRYPWSMGPGAHNWWHGRQTNCPGKLKTEHTHYAGETLTEECRQPQDPWFVWTSLSPRYEDTPNGGLLINSIFNKKYWRYICQSDCMPWGSANAMLGKSSRETTIVGYLPNWKLVTKERWIWDTVVGFKIVNTHAKLSLPQNYLGEGGDKVSPRGSRQRCRGGTTIRCWVSYQTSKKRWRSKTSN